MSNNDRFLIQYGDSSFGLTQGEQTRALEPHVSQGNASLLDWLLGEDAPPADDLIATLDGMTGDMLDSETLTTHAPVSRQEIWAAGVTYKRSEEAREAESHNSTIYTKVYSAVRPELFFKANGYDVVDPGDPVGIRADADWSVPEPELVVVVNARMEVVGFTIGNDMSSRDIEGANPLYLPQAKVYERACALGPRLWLHPGAKAWPDVSISLQIEREGRTVFNGETSTNELHRPMMELIEYLGRCKRYPYGAMLFTGTGIVPPDTFTLLAGDEVRIRIDPIGELVNPVQVVGRTALDAAARPR